MTNASLAIRHNRARAAQTMKESTMTKNTPESAVFYHTPYEREDGTVDGALIDAFVEHSKATGAYFDITPYERPDGSLDDAWADAFIQHGCRRAAEKMKRLAAAEHDDDE